MAYGLKASSCDPLNNMYHSYELHFHRNNKYILKKTHKMEEMQLKSKGWRMLHPLYN